MQRSRAPSSRLALMSLMVTAAGGLDANVASAQTTSGQVQASSIDSDNPKDRLLDSAASDAGTGWLLGIGGALSQPGYVGGREQFTPFPLLFYHRGRFFVAGISAGYLLSSGPHHRLSLAVMPEFSRLDAKDSPQLAGIRNRQWSLDGGASMEVFGRWGRYDVSVFHDVLNRSNGTEVSTGYQYPVQLGRWRLTPGAGLRWQNANLVDYYYGVSPAEAIPGRAAYSPSSALSPYADVSLSTPITRHWRFRASAQYLRFADSIRDSPIVDRAGSASLILGFTYDPRAQ